MNLQEGISILEINKIFSNSTLKREYLNLLSHHIEIDLNGLRVRDLDNKIIETWSYNISKQVIRELFVDSEKYLKNRDAGDKIEALMVEWCDLGLGEFDWPFQPKMFDEHVHSINRRLLTEIEKDNIVANDAIRYRRIKDINARRNDYIEFLIFANNDNVIPTFRNARGVDFYIDGQSFDQKVSRSVGRNFINEYGENYRQIAIQNPELVAKCLYEYQDEERFGYEPRLLVVYLDSDLELEDIEASIAEADLTNPTNIEFEYLHSNGQTATYGTYCYVILLHR